MWLGASLTLAASLLFFAYRRHSTGVFATAPGVAASLLGRSAMTVSPGIHLLGGLSPSAAYVVETSDGLILVDSGLDREAGPSGRRWPSWGSTGSVCGAILLTHVHGDHTGGAEALRGGDGRQGIRRGGRRRGLEGRSLARGLLQHVLHPRSRPPPDLGRRRTRRRRE